MARTEYDPADTDCVISASNYLEISEFDIFMEAYADWYGKVPPEKQMEKVFSHYLLENNVPFWVGTMQKTACLRSIFSQTQRGLTHKQPTACSMLFQ